MAESASKGTKSTGGAKATPEDMEAEIARLREDVAKLKDHLSSTGKTARKSAGEGVQQLRAQGEATVRDMEAQLIETVREKPLKAIAWAAGVGYLAAILTRR